MPTFKVQIKMSELNKNKLPFKDSAAAINAAKAAIEMASRDVLFNPRKLIMHTDQGGAYIADDYISIISNIYTSDNEEYVHNITCGNTNSDTNNAGRCAM